MEQRKRNEEIFGGTALAEIKRRVSVAAINFLFNSFNHPDK